MQTNAARVYADENHAPAGEASPHLGVGSGDSSEPINVLLIVPTLDVGAAASNVMDIAGILTRAGHRALVVSRSGLKAEEICREGREWIEVDVASLNPAVMLANALRLARIVRERGCHVIHAHGRAGAWSAFLAARLTGRPLVTTWYKGFRDQNLLKHFYNGVMARGDHVVAVNDQIADLIGERYRTAPERLQVLPAGIDAARFDPAIVSPERIEAVRRNWGLHPKTRVLLVASRLLRRKGHHIVVQAARQLKALGLKDFVCVFASVDAGTRYAGELWDQVLATDTADVVRLAGRLDDMPAAYASATAVLSAAVQQEGIQRAILEAQAMGRPVIVSTLGAGAEQVLAPPAVAEDRMTGLRFPAGDAAALAAMVVRLFAMPEAERAAMGARARARVLTNFAAETIAIQTLALYSGLVHGRSTA